MGVHILVGGVAARVPAGSVRPNQVALRCAFSTKPVLRSTAPALRREVLREIALGNLDRLHLLTGLSFARKARLARAAETLDIRIPDGVVTPKSFTLGKFPNGQIFSLAFSD